MIDLIIINPDTGLDEKVIVENLNRLKLKFCVEPPDDDYPLSQITLPIEEGNKDTMIDLLCKLIPCNYDIS